MTVTVHTKSCFLLSHNNTHKAPQNNELSHRHLKHRKRTTMAIIKRNIAPIDANRKQESCAPRKAVSFHSKFVMVTKVESSFHQDSALQSTSKRRRYMRRGSKSASMLMDANTVRQDFNMMEPSEIPARSNEERTPFIHDSRDGFKTNQSRREPLKLYSSVSLVDQVAYLEGLLASASAE